MRVLSIAVLCAVASTFAGCVTEGGLALEPASRDEQAQANLDLGVGYLRQERPDIAIDALQRALDIDPRMAEAHSAIAIAYDQTGDDDVAEEHHERAAALAPANPTIQNAYAVFLCLRDRWTDAEPYFRRAIDESPGPGLSYMINAGTCARSSGQASSAEGFYRSALAVEPSSLDALHGLVDVLIQQENYLPARAFWQRLEQVGPLRAEDLLSCYVIETALGDSTAALSCADRLREQFPGSAPLQQLNRLQRNGR